MNLSNSAAALVSKAFHWLLGCVYIEGVFSSGKCLKAEMSPIRVPEHVILLRFINNTISLCMCPWFDFRLLGLFDDTYVPVI